MRWLMSAPLWRLGKAYVLSFDINDKFVYLFPETSGCWGMLLRNPGYNFAILIVGVRVDAL